MPGKKYEIRKFEERDRQAMGEICASRGFLGEPIDKIFCDRELFNHMILGPYLDLEPEHTLVGDNGQEVIGYFMGSSDPHFGRKAAPYAVGSALRMIGRALSGKYDKRSRKYLWWMLTKGIKETPKNPEGYANFHMNMRRDYDGAGIRLLLAYEQMLRDTGIKGYFGRVFSYPGRSERVYTRYGVKVFDKVKTTMYEPETAGQDIFRVCVVKDFADDKGSKKLCLARVD